MNFDLVDDPWVPVVTARGRELASLRRCLVEAPSILGLSVEAPLEAVAVFRQVLLPVYLDAVFAASGSRLPRSEAEWAQLWANEALDRRAPWVIAGAGADVPIAAYLERHRDAFRVFGDRPFAQVAGLCTKGEKTKPISVLIASAASGNNVPLFSARTEGDPPTLGAAEAIRAVLATHCWDTAAIKSGAIDDPAVKAGKTTGNPTGPVGAIGVVLPLGRTLAETLRLHVPIRAEFADGDRPHWRAADTDADAANRPTWRARPARGLLDLLTWQSRRIRLVPEPGPDGEPVVRQVVLAAGDRLHRIPHDDEPHAAWRLPKGGKELLPVRHTAGQAAWRGMRPMLATVPTRTESSSPVLIQIGRLRARRRLPAEYPLRVLMVGVQYGNQSAVVEDVIVDLMPMPVAALRAAETATPAEAAAPTAVVDDDAYPPYRVLEDMVEQADRLRVAANRLGDDLRRAAGGPKVDWDKGQRVGDQMVHEFTPVARRVLAHLQSHPRDAEGARTAWAVEAGRVAWVAGNRSLDAASPQTFLGRVGGERQPPRASAAEAWYRRAIRDTLGRPEPATDIPREVLRS